MNRWWAAAAFAAPMLATGTAWSAPTEPFDLTTPIEPWTNCSACHNFPNPIDHAGEPEISPMAWQGTMMANSAKDPVFWAAMALAFQDEPAETTDCVRCHAPAAFLAGEGGAIAADEISEDLRGGVECELCHRTVDDGVTLPGNARYTIDDNAVDGFVPRRGPWTYVDGGPGPPHPWSDDVSHIGTSAMCGMCHDVTTARDRVDEDGASLGILFNEQRTYSEWLNSDFSVAGVDFLSCQDCHMPAVDDVAGCETLSLVGDTHATGGRRHDLVGANRHAILLVRELYGSAGVHEVPDFQYDRTIETLDEFLLTSATLEIDVDDEIDISEGVDLTVTVTNESGHKLPTGYSEGRMMWLEVTATLGEEVLFASGQWDETRGFGDDDTVRRYEALAESSSDGTQLHLLKNDRWLVDNRIPPRGLTADIETDPVGDRYTLLPDDTWPNFDIVEYSFDPVSVVDPTADEDDIATVTVRLLYLINTPEYLRLLEDDNVTNDAGEALTDLLTTVGTPQPQLVAELNVDVSVIGLEPAEGDGTTTTADTSTTSGGTSTSGPEPTTATTDPDSASSAEDSSGGTSQNADDTSGCGCTSAAGAPGWWLSFLCVVLGVRRRERSVTPFRSIFWALCPTRCGTRR